MHVVDTLGRAGIETWLMHAMRTSPSIRERSSFCVTVGIDRGPDTYRAEIEALGIPIHRLGFARGIRFTWALAALLRHLRPQVVHVHKDFLSGWGVAAARLAGVPHRIAHYHVTFPDRHDNFAHRSYIRGIRGLERLFATRVLGCSVAAIESYCGPDWRDDPRRQVLYYGIDFAPFEQEVDPIAVRAELGLPGGAFVVGHVGIFRLQKNHAFLLDVAAELVAREPRARLLLVGDGDLRPEIERKIAALGLGEHVVLAGVRADVARLMLGAMDAFVFPSRNEGLGIVLLEAQAAGLPCVVSDVVPAEASVVAELTDRRSLSESPARWAEAVLALRDRSDLPQRAEALARLQRSSFELHRAIGELETIYPK